MYAMGGCMKRAGAETVILSKRVMLDNCRGNIVKLPDDHIAVLNNLDGYIVAEHDGKLLICKLSEEQRIKQFSE